jgi:hypothetical protein
MVERRVLLIALAMLIVFSTSALIVHSTSDPAFLLSPQGTVRVALQVVGSSTSTGSATWNAIAPRVFDGAFSAKLVIGGSPGDGGGVFIGPLSFPLSDLTNDRITFWVYHFDGVANPHVNIVLDNGRTLEGKDSTPVDSSITPKCESGAGCQVWPSANIWVQMMPTDSFTTSFPSDPVLTAACASPPCNLATWIAGLPGTNVIQIQITFTDAAPPKGTTVFIDDVDIFPNGSSIVVPIEPETVSSSDH